LDDSLINLEIVTPGKVVFSDEVKSFTAPGEVGSFQILPHHAAFITNLVPGKVKFITKDDAEKIFATSGGVVEVHDNKISMLAETIEAKEDIDIHRALAAKEKAEKLVTSEHGTELEKAKVKLLRAKNRLYVAGYEG
jgi:F-type H+-transporting ATPase subunit epsilon